MFNYYLKLALYNIKRAALVNFLVVFTIAIGVGLISANLTLVNTMMSNPVAEKSDRLFHISMNTWPDDDPQEEPFHILRYRDTLPILNYSGGKHKMVSYTTSTYSRAAESETLKRYQSIIRATTKDFFAITNAPFAYGTGFTEDNSQSLVIGHRLNMKLFNGENSVGKKIELEGQEFVVSGVLKPWQLRPRFYHPTEGMAFNRTEDLFMPLETVIDLGLFPHGRASSTERVNELHESREKSMYYLQAWIEFDQSSEVTDFQTYLDAYTQGLKDAGEHPNEIINDLDDVQTWLEKQDLVDDQIIALLVASILFLIVCIFNASSLLLSRFHAAKFEIGLRRAIGANKGHLLQQNLVESLLLGVMSGLLALALAWSFLEVSVVFLPHLKNLVSFELPILIGGIALAILTTTLSAIYPMYRMSRYTISAELKG